MPWRKPFRNVEIVALLATGGKARKAPEHHLAFQNMSRVVRSSLIRMTIDIDEQLLAKAMKLGGFKTKKATIEAALRLVVALDERHGAQATLPSGSDPT
jgi:Arc/MetJ family transcription regulator